MTEQVIIDIMWFLAFIVFNSCFIFVCYYFMLTPKYNVWVTVVIPSVIFYVQYSLTYFTLPMLVKFIMQFFFYYFPALSLFKDKLKKRLFAASLLLAVSMVMDFAISLVTLSLFGYAAVQQEVKTWDCVIQAVFINSVLAAVFAATVLIWRTKINHYPVKSLAVFIFFPICQTIGVFGYYYDPKSPFAITRQSPFENPFAPVTLVLYIVSDIMMILVLRENSKAEQLKLQLKDMEHETELQTQYYKNLTEQFSEIREYRHDIKNLVAAAEITVRNGLKEDGISMLDELKERADSLSIPIFCANPIVNSVLWEKRRECEAEGVAFSLTMARDEEIPFDKADACSLFANLLDNAIREAKTTSSPAVSLTCRSNIGILFLEVRNTSDKAFTSAPHTTKAEKGHGNGLLIVEKIAQKYGGTFKIAADGKEAVASFSAPLPDKQQDEPAVSLSHDNIPFSVDS